MSQNDDDTISQVDSSSYSSSTDTPSSSCDSPPHTHTSYSEQEVVNDSQASEWDSPINNHELKEDDYPVTASEEEANTTELFFSDDQFPSDRILGYTEPKTITGATESNHLADNEGNVIRFKQFEPANHFDHNIVTTLEKIQELTDQIDSSPEKKTTANTSDNDKKTQIRKQLKRPIPACYEHMLLSENISGQFQDWHFITEPPTWVETVDLDLDFIGANNKTKHFKNIKDLLASFGVARDKFVPNLKIKNMDRYDTLNGLVPVDTMCRQLGKYIDDPQFVKYFFCFILDRKIYSSLDFDPQWCDTIFKRLNKRHMIRVYFDLLSKDNYFLHFRAVRQIPQLQDLLIKHIFPYEDCKVIQTRIVGEFNNLIDKRQFRDLLYFILFIFGSTPIPFGRTRITEYFRECVYDVGGESVNQVEITIIRSYVNMFIKMNQ